MNPRRVLALLLAVAAAVIVIRLASPEPTTAPVTAVTSPATSVPGAVPAASAAAAGPAGASTGPGQAPQDIDDDSLHQPDSTPTAIPGDAAEAAARFAHAWTRHTGPAAASWADRLAELSTPTLAGKLRGIDPQVVPADTVTGTPQVTSTAGGVDASITTDAGTLQLTLIHHGRWQVDTLGWTPKP